MSIDKIIIEDFKIFEGQHIFDLKNLNIFTGANNSGKSTLFKAITLFAKGLERGDFPSIDLFGNNAGEFKNLLNHNTTKTSFKIGFVIELGLQNEPFKILYEFGDGKGSYTSQGMAQFLNFEILDLSDNFYFGVYNVERFVVTKKNIEYVPESNVFQEGATYPFKSPMDENNPAELFIKFDLDNLNRFIKVFSNTDFSELILHLNKLRGIHNNFWSEQFIEEDFDDIGIKEFYLENLLRDIYKDEFKNLGDYKTKEILLFGGQDEEKVWKEYLKLRDKLKYNKFIEEVIQPLFESIDKGLDFFRQKNFNHIQYQSFSNRLINKDKTNEYLFSLFSVRNESNLNSFVREALKIFGIDGYIEIVSYKNTVLELFLVTGLDKTDKERHDEYQTKCKNEERPMDNYDKKFGYYIGSPTLLGNYSQDYENNEKESINDLGKGTANLIGIILKSFHIFYVLQKTKKNEKVMKSLGYNTEKVKKKLVLIEEPEVFLHPNWQSKLADFLVFCSNYGKSSSLEHRKIETTILVETHSVYLIQRLQYLVATQEIKPENLCVTFFNTDEEKEKFYKMKIRKDGIFINKFGTGFYDETANLTIDILNEQNLN